MNFYSAASCWIPDLIVESGWIDHAPFAFWITEALQPRTFVELGTHRGYSYFVFNQAIKQLGVKTRSFAIDTWAGDEHAGFFGDEVFQQVEAHNNEHYGDFSELIRSTFDDAVSRFTDGSLDLLHIDGRHFYEDIKHDFETWKGKLSTRGVVLIHDTNVRVRDFGVYRMWEELSAQYPSFEFLHGHGLGVLALGEEVPEVIRQLCDVSKDAARTLTIRALYSRLGKAIPKVAIQRPIEQMHTGDQELQKLNQEVQELKQDIQSRDDQIAKLKEEEFTKQNLNQEVQKLKQDIQSRDDQIAKL
ncbi:MAG: glycosyl transferase family 2, partial [Bryobacterales bacterium]|nr:glycosyl transferase family 2 [Bryobacterales bacterium]